MNSSSARLPWLLAAICLCISCPAFGQPSPDVTKEPARETFLLLPLHVHVLSCKDQPEIDCKLTDADIERIVKKANGVWHKAGIHFCLQPLLREEAENVKAFMERKAAQPEMPLGFYRTLAPEKSRKLPGLHVYYVHQLPPNGVYLGQNICFVKETASLRKVEGGIDEPLPRVTSHELGHALSLPHRQNTTNLLASGTTGTLLNEAEVEATRKRAKQIEGAMTVEECKKAQSDAKEKGEADRAEVLARFLAEVLK